MTRVPPIRLVLVGAQAPFGPEIARRLAGAGHQVLALDAPGLAGWLAQTEDRSAVSALVVNVPVARSALRFDAVDDAAFAQALQTQLVDVVQLTQAVLPRMHAGARIVFVGGRGHLGAWGGAHQMAAGAALVAMARSMALELAPDGIRVNMVAAEFVGDRGDTPTLRAGIAHAVEFLCAPELGITGETLLIDGQAALRMSESRNAGDPPMPASPVSGTAGHAPP